MNNEDKLIKSNREYVEQQRKIEKDIKLLLKKHFGNDIIYDGHQYKLSGDDKYIKIFVKSKPHA